MQVGSITIATYPDGCSPSYEVLKKRLETALAQLETLKECRAGDTKQMRKLEADNKLMFDALKRMERLPRATPCRQFADPMPPT